MSFVNPLQLSGKQLENYNNSQKALHNIGSPQQSNQLQNTQLPHFGSQNSAAPFTSNLNKQTPQHGKQVSFSENPKQEEVKQPELTSESKYNLNSRVGAVPNKQALPQQNNSQGVKNNTEREITQLVQQSDQKFRQLEDQFKSLNSVRSQKGISSDKHSIPILKPSTNGISNIKSEVDKLIWLAQQQNQQSASELQGRKKHDQEIGKIRNFSGGRSYISNSPSKKSKQKKSSKKKQKGRRDSDDTSSYSDESDSIIHEQDNESNFDDSYENDKHAKKGRGHSNNKRGNKNEAKDNYPKNKMADLGQQRDQFEKRSNSNYSRNHSHNSKQQQMKAPTQQLSKANLKQLPSSGVPQKGENSVYSSASRMREQQALKVSQNTGFRRCYDESEEEEGNGQNYLQQKQQKNFQRKNSQEDSFDIDQDFQIIPSSRQSKLSQRPQEENFSSRQAVIASNVNHRRAVNNDSDEELDYRPYIPQGAGEYASARDGISQVSGLSLQKYNQKNQAVDDDNVIFCINCEEYIKDDKVDEHSNVCQTNKEEKLHNQNQYLQKINEKLIKIRFLIKNKQVHLVSSYQNSPISPCFETALELLSESIETNTQVNKLDEVEHKLKFLNSQILKINDSYSHNLLYLTQKSIEFVQRKIEFIERYMNRQGGNEVNNQDQQYEKDYYANQQQQHQYKQYEKEYSYQPQKMNHQQFNSERVNFDTISVASSALKQNQSYQKFQKDPIQIFQNVDSNLDILKQKNSQLFRDANQNQMNQLQQQNVDLRQPLKQQPFTPNYQQNQQEDKKQRNAQPFSVLQNRAPFKPVEVQKDEQDQSYHYNQAPMKQRNPQIENRSASQPFTQKPLNLIEPVETVTVKESQITRPSNAKSNQNPFQPFNPSIETDNRKQKFFSYTYSLKQRYPNSNKYLISELWSEVQLQGISENGWEKFLIEKFR